MKKINLRGLQEKLSSKELKNVLGGSATGKASLKCFNDGHSCDVDSCPGSRADAEELCLTANCGGGFGDYISCAYVNGERSSGYVFSRG